MSYRLIASGWDAIDVAIGSTQDPRFFGPLHCGLVGWCLRAFSETRFRCARAGFPPYLPVPPDGSTSKQRLMRVVWGDAF
jgi:hypothetical protein